MDGSIRIETVFETKDAKKNVEQLYREMERLKSEEKELGKDADIYDTEKMREYLAELEKSAKTEIENAKTKKEAAKIANEYKDIIEQTKADYFEYTNRVEANAKAINDTSAAYDNAKAKYQELLDKQKQDNDLLSEQTRLENLLARQDKMQALGVSPDSQAWRSLQYDIEQAKDKVAKLGGEVGDVDRKAKKVESSSSKFGKLFAGAKNQAKKFASAIGTGAKNALKMGANIGKKVVGGLKNAVSHMKSLKSHSDGLFKKFTKVGLALVGIRGIMGGLRQIVRSAMDENEQSKNQITAIKGVLGTALAPVIQYIADLLGKVITFADGLIKAFTGVSLVAKYNANQANKMAESTQQAAEAAKEYKNQLAGFDVVNKLNDETSNTASASSPSQEAQQATFELQELSNFAQGLIDKIKQSWADADFTDLGEMLATKISTALDNILWESIKKKANKLGTSFATFLNGVFSDDAHLTTSLGNTIGESINTAVQLGLGFVENFNFNNFGVQLGKGLNATIKKTNWGDLAKLIGDSIFGALDTATNFLETVDYSAIVDSIVEFITNIPWSRIISKAWELTGAIIGGTGSLIVNLLKKAWDGLKEYFEPFLEESGGNVLSGILNGIVNGLANISTWIVNNIFMPLINGFKKAFDIHSPSKHPDIIELGVNIIKGVFNGIINWMKNIGTWVKENIFDKVKEAFKKAGSLAINIVASFKENAKAKYANLQKKITAIKDKAVSILGSFKENAKAKYANLKKKINAIKGKTIEITAKFKDVITKALNLFIGKINTLIAKLRNIKIGSFAPFSGLKDIPKLAKGGIAYNPGAGAAAIVGEVHPEAILPLTDDVFGKIAALLDSNREPTGGQIVIPVHIGNALLTKYVVDLQNKRAFELNKGGAY